MERAERLMSYAKRVDSIVIVNGSEPFLDPAFWYVTEQRSGVFEGAMAIISKDGTLDVITNSLEESTAREGKGNIHVCNTRRKLNSTIKKILGPSKRIGMNTRSASYAAAEYIRKISSAKITDISKTLRETTVVKDAKEIEAVRRACGISSETADAIPGMLSAGMTEREMASEIDMMMCRKGGEGNAFDTISAFGENSAKPHHTPSDRRLMDGDTALFDFGCRYGRYCSDLTRTVFFKEPDPMMKRAYEVVAEAKAAGTGMIMDGVRAKEVDLAARHVIEASEFKGMFIHSFGHAVGMSVHDGLTVSHRSDDILKEGMIITAEPGIYIPGLGGIRIEDTVLVKKDGCEPLTRFDQGLTVIR